MTPPTGVTSGSEPSNGFYPLVAAAVAGLDALRERAAGEVLGTVRTFLAEHRLPDVEPRVVAKRSNVVVALEGLPDGAPPLVVRSPSRTDLLAGQCPADPWRHRLEVGLARRLVAAGAPVVPPAGPADLLPAGPVVVEGRVLTVWRAADPPSCVDPATVGAALRALHEAAAGLGEFAAAAVPLGPVTADVDRVLATAAATGEVAPSLLPRLRAAADLVVGPLLAGRAAAPDRWQLVHGDAHPGNLLVLDGRLVWNDLEDTCLAPVGWDLGTLYSSAMIDGSAAVAGYGGIDLESLRPWIRARQVQRAVWTALRARTAAELSAVHALIDALLRSY